MRPANYSFSGKRYPIFAGMKVRVYRNLNRKAASGAPIFSLKSVTHVDELGAFDSIQSGHVFHHAENIVLENCTFKVTVSGWNKNQNTGVKSVFATVNGYLREWDKTLDQLPDGQNISFNRHEYPCFFMDGKPIEIAPKLLIAGCHENGIWETRMISF